MMGKEVRRENLKRRWKEGDKKIDFREGVSYCELISEL